MTNRQMAMAALVLLIVSLLVCSGLGFAVWTLADVGTIGT